MLLFTHRAVYQVKLTSYHKLKELAQVQQPSPSQHTGALGADGCQGHPICIDSLPGPSISHSAQLQFNNPIQGEIALQLHMMPVPLITTPSVIMSRAT